LPVIEEEVSFVYKGEKHHKREGNQHGTLWYGTPSAGSKPKKVIITLAKRGLWTLTRKRVFSCS